MKNGWEARVQALIEKRGMTMKSASLAAGKGETFVRDLLKRGRVPSIENLQALARALGVSVADLMSAPTVPVVGHVGAGGEWHLGDGSETGAISAPPEATPATVAVKIRGDSMGSFLNGWYALYDDMRNPPTDDLIGRPCVVWTADGRAMVKILRRGTKPGVWSLHSGMGDPIEDVVVVAAAPVIGFQQK